MILAPKDLLLKWAESEGIGLDPSRSCKGNIPKGNIDPIKKEHSLLFPFEKCTSKDDEPLSSLTYSVLALFYSFKQRAFKIKQIIEILEKNRDVNKGSVKQIIYRLKRNGLIRRLPRHYYILRDYDRAQQYLSPDDGADRVPFKGMHPDNETPYQNEQKGNSPNNTLPDNPFGVKTQFHAVRFKGVIIPKERFIKLRNNGRLIRGSKKSRQWRYYGVCYDIHISEKTFTSWGVLKKKGWQQEIILDFGPETYGQVIHHISAHCAIEDTDINLNFIENNNKSETEITFDKGSQLNTDEFELEGPVDQISTLKMFFVDPVKSINKLSQLERSYSYLAKCQGDLVSFATDTRYSVNNINEKMDTIISSIHKGNTGGMDYHR